jgi:hypothetical protein
VSTLTLMPLVADREEGEPTLDDLLAGVWEGLSARHAVRCPVCAGEMVPAVGEGGRSVAEDAGGRSVAGRCRDCGTTLR